MFLLRNFVHFVCLTETGLGQIYNPCDEASSKSRLPAILIGQGYCTFVLKTYFQVHKLHEKSGGAT